MTSEPNYGEKAKLDRDLESLTNKQRRAVTAVAEADAGVTNQDLAEQAEVHSSYISKVQVQFPHLIDELGGVSEDTACPDCGKTFDDRQALSGHISSPYTDCESDDTDDIDEDAAEEIEGSEPGTETEQSELVESSAASQYEYGPDAQTDRDLGSLTDKQRRTVNAIAAADMTMTAADIAEEASVSATYVAYCRDHFPHLISDFRGAADETGVPAADGGEQAVTFRATGDQAQKMVRVLPDDLSDLVWEQVWGWVMNDDGPR